MANWLFLLKKVLMYISAVFKVIYHEPLELQELTPTEVPVLKLNAVTGKILGPGISKRQDIFVTWKSTESEIFWEFHLPTKGLFNINIAYSNIKNIARTKLLLKFGDNTKNQSLDGYTEYSGGWDSIKILEVGSVMINHVGKYRLVLRAVEMQGRQACDLHYVTISGPFQELTPTDIPVLKFNADTGKILGTEISKRQDIFVSWKSTESEIFWEFHLPTKGLFNINIAYSNVKNIARTKLQLKLGDHIKNQSLETYTEYSGGWDSIKILEVGSVMINHVGKYRLVLRAVEMQGGQACDLHYVTISGPFQELTPIEVPVLKLNSVTGKILGTGVYKRQDIFVTWVNTKSVIFWEFHLPTKGLFNINIAYSNIKEIARTKLLLIFGGNTKYQALEGYTEYSGGWDNINILAMGSVTINQTGKYRLGLRAVEMQGGQACDLHYVTIVGPIEVHVIKLNSVTGKVFGTGVNKRQDIFVNWVNTKSEIFWEFHLPTKGLFKVHIAYSNIKNIARTKLLLKFGDNTKNQSLEGYTEYSGGWDNINILAMGSVTINQTGKYRLVLRAVEMQEGQACNLHYVTILGPIEVPVLKLNSVTGKVFGTGVNKRQDIFVNWVNTKSEIFWDLRLPNKGLFNVHIAYSNIKNIARTKLLFKFGDNTKNHSLESYTEYSGGWDSIKILEMGSVAINQAGKYRLVLRAVEMQGRQACNLHYVNISGPGVSGGVIVDIFPLNADSVHLSFPTDEKTQMFYNEVIVDETYPSTFFMACGFQHGYFGIQDVDFNGRKRSIFSLWDVKGEALIDEDDLASVVRDGENVTVKRFGGEGTGYQSLYDFTWNIGEIQRFLLTATPDGKFTIFTAFIYLHSHRQWKLMASLKRRQSYLMLEDYYSFLEDWAGKWGFLSRQASFNPWYRDGNGEWVQIKTATFTRTGNNSNVNGWTRNNRFYLRTGGDTINTIYPHEVITRRASDQIPQQLKDIDKIITKELFIP